MKHNQKLYESMDRNNLFIKQNDALFHHKNLSIIRSRKNIFLESEREMYRSPARKCALWNMSNIT